MRLLSVTGCHGRRCTLSLLFRYLFKYLKTIKRDRKATCESLNNVKDISTCPRWLSHWRNFLSSHGKLTPWAVSAFITSRKILFSTNFDSRRKKGRRLTPRAFKVSISTTEAFSRLFIFMCTRRDDFSFALEKMINVDSGKSWRNLFLFTTTNYLSTALLWVVKRAFISCFCCFTCGNHQHKSLFFVHGKMI